MIKHAKTDPQMKKIIQGMTISGWLLESQIRTAMFRDDLWNFLHLETAKLPDEINIRDLLTISETQAQMTTEGSLDVVKEFLESCAGVYGKQIFSPGELENICKLVDSYLEKGAGYHAENWPY